MSKYLILMYSKSSEAYLQDGGAEYESIDEAVKSAMEYGTNDFWVITKHDWVATPNQPEETK